MNKAEKILCDFMHDFTDKHWDKITSNKDDLGIPKEKLEWLKEIKNDVQSACWMLRECCLFHMDKKYLNELYVPKLHEEDLDVIKVGNDYIIFDYDRKNHNYKVMLAEATTVIVTKFVPIKSNNKNK